MSTKPEDQSTPVPAQTANSILEKLEQVQQKFPHDDDVLVYAATHPRQEVLENTEFEENELERFEEEVGLETITHCYAERLGLGKQVKEIAQEALDHYDFGPQKEADTVAASSLYLAGRATGNGDLTQQRIGESLDVSEEAIRQTYQKMAYNMGLK